MKTININIFLLIILILSATSCIKHPPKTFTIKGKLLKDCGGDVMANTDVKLGSKSQVFTHGFTAYSQTDKDGNFSISYKRNGGTEILFSANGNAVVNYIPNNRDIDLGVIYYHPTCNFVFKIVVDNPYPLGDSVLFPSHNRNGNSHYGYTFKFAAPLPFKDTMFIINDYYSIKERYFSNLNKIPVRLAYSVYNNNDSLYKYIVYDTLIPNCNWPPDTLLLVVK